MRYLLIIAAICVAAGPGVAFQRVVLGELVTSTN